MNIVKHIRNTLKRCKQKRWKKLFWAIDLHETIIEPTYSGNTPQRMYPYARRVLRVLTQRHDMCLILFTSTSEEDLKGTLKFFKEQGIKFDYINRNPECPSEGYSDFSTKYHFDVMLENKGGFEPSDWETIYRFLIEKVQIRIKHGVGRPIEEDKLCLHPGIFKGDIVRYLVDHDPTGTFSRGHAIEEEELEKFIADHFEALV